MVDTVGHGISSILVCPEEAASKITRSMSSSLEYLQSKHIAELNSTIEQEAFSEKDKEDAMKPRSYQDNVEAIENRDYNIHETLLNYSKLDTDKSQHHQHPAISDSQETVSADQLLHGHEDEDMKSKLEKVRKLLLLLAILAACITYQAGLSPPGGFWNENKADHDVSDPVPSNDNNRSRYVVFYYCNGTSFVSSVVIIVLLVSRKVFARGIQSNVLSACVILVLFGLTGAFAAVSSRWASTSIYVSILVFAVLVCIMLQVLVRVGSGSLAETSVLGHKNEDMKLMKPDKERKYLMLLAVLVASVTYQAGLSPPGGLWQENKVDLVVGDPEPNDNHRRRMAFFYCNATAFVSSEVIIVLLMSRKLFARGIQSNVLSACVILDLFGLTGAFAAVSSRRVSTSIYVFILIFAVLVYIMLHVLVRVGSGSLAETSVLGHNGGRSRYLLIFATLDLFGQIGENAAGRCSESADPAVVYEDDPNRSIKHSPREATWRVACAAPHHMTGNQSELLTGGYYLPMLDGNDNEGIVVPSAGNGEALPLQVCGSGSVRTESIALDDVWYVPGLDSNLVSTGQLARQGCAINLGPGGCRITREGALVGTARFTEACQFELDFLKVAASSM